MMKTKTFTGTRVPAAFSTKAKLSAMAALLMLASVPSWATTLMVDSQSGDGGDGLSWATAHNSIQDAIDQLNGQEGDIWVKAGTYTGIDENVIEMGENIDLFGGFAGTETTLDQRDWNLNRTIIDGENERRGVLGANEATLDGFVVTKGMASSGAGMYNLDASPTIMNCTFIKNQRLRLLDNSGGSGAGLCNENSSAKVISCSFINNFSDTSGAGISNFKASSTIINCIFSDNLAYSYGGAVLNMGSDTTILNCTFTENTAKTSGGGVYNSGALPDTESFPIIRNSIFWKNGTDITGGKATVEYCCIQGDHSSDGNITEDPLLDPATFRPLPQSPCIDMGNSEISDIPLTDFSGNDRIQNNLVDMGAYEYTPGTSSTEVTVTLTPDETLPLDPKWRLSGGEWQSSGNTIEIYPGDYRVDFSTISQWEKPEELTFFVPTTGISGDFSYQSSPGNHTIYVNENSLGNNNGSSWENAFNDIQSAIDASPTFEYTELWVAGGTYTGTGDNVIETTHGTKLYGGFTGIETSREQRDWEQNLAIIDGESNRRGALCTYNTILNGFTITNGSSLSNGGGGLRAYGSPVIENCTFDKNTAADSSGAGGGVYTSGSAKFINCDFSNNSSSSRGGGIYLSSYFSRPVLTGCTFLNNDAEDYGGAIYSENTLYTMTGCTIANNSADRGAGIYNDLDSFRFQDDDPPALIDGCTIENNTARIEGGGIFNIGDHVSLNISNTYISSNSAQVFGAGIYNDNTNPTISNCLLANNNLPRENTDGGMAVYNEDSSPVFTNCVFTKSYSPPFESIIYNTYSSPEFINCISWGNDVNGFWNSDQHSSPTARYCCLNSTIPGEGNFYTDPLFADPDNGDYRLLPDSPCIDAATAEGAPDTDIRGIARPQDNGIDMGAYEFFRPLDQVENPTTLIADLSVPTEQDGWFFNRPEIYRDIEALHDQQTATWDLIVSGNEMTFGYLESPTLSVTENDDPQKGNSLVGEIGSQHLYRATYFISSDLENTSTAPVIRLRISSESFQRSDMIVVSSEQHGDMSPNIEGRLYTTYFQMPENETNFRLDLDVLNFNPNDTKQATVFLRYAEVEYLGNINQLGTATPVISEDFMTIGASGWNPFPTEEGLIPTPETFSSNIGEGLLIRGMEAVSGKQEPGNSAAIFGYWSKKCTCYPLAKSLYRISWSVGTDAEDLNPEQLPTFRLRFNDDSMKFASLVNIDSVSQNTNLPSVSNPVIYDSWFVAPPEVTGNNWELSFDYLFVDKAAPEADDPTAALILQSVDVTRYDIP
jgi:predicted outer membrane repeat protein